MAKPTSTGGRGKRLRLAAILAAVAVGIVAAMAGGAFADLQQVDNDLTSSGLQNSVALGTVTGGSAQTTSGKVVIKYSGNNHLATGDVVHFVVSTAQTTLPAGYTVAPVDVTIPANWDDAHCGASLSCSVGTDSAITFTAPTVGGSPSYTVKWKVDTSKTEPACISATPSCLSDDPGGGPALTITLTVPSASTNHDPVISSTTNNGPVDEGSPATITVTATDQDSTDTLAYEFDCNNDGTYEIGPQASNQANCTFPDGPATPTVGVRVTDGNGGSDTDSTVVTVNNVNPAVLKPTWASNPINCQSSATLQNISFSDAGVIDYPWTLNIGWGDSSSDYTDTNVLTQGSYTNQSHTYTTPGNYTATVGVTDKDTGYGSNTSASLTVNQVYTVSFLQPLDASTPAKVIGNTVKRGRVVPVKAIITDACTGSLVTDPTKNVTIVVKDTNFTVNATDAVETFSDAGSSSAGTTAFRWTADSSAPGGGFWIYNLDTSGFSIGTSHFVYVKVGTTQASTNYADVVTTK